MRVGIIGALVGIITPFIALSLASTQAQAADAPAVTGKVLHVADADTFTVMLNDCRPAIVCKVKVRVLGIDSPESKAGGGKGGAKCGLMYQEHQAFLA